MPNATANDRGGLPWLAAVVVIVGLYVGGYFGLGREAGTVHYGIRWRSFPAPWVGKLYYPLTWAEAKITRRSVWIVDGADLTDSVFHLKEFRP